jgi:hypothetical protein
MLRYTALLFLLKVCLIIGQKKGKELAVGHIPLSKGLE